MQINLIVVFKKINKKYSEIEKELIFIINDISLKRYCLAKFSHLQIEEPIMTRSITAFCSGRMMNSIQELGSANLAESSSG